IKKSYYDEIFNLFKAQQEQNNGPEVWEKDINGKKFIDYAKEELLNSLIDETILLKKAADIGIVAPKEQIDGEIEYIKQMFESDEKYEEYLISQNITEEYIVNDLTKRIIINNLVNEITKSIEIPEDELKTIYDSMKDSFISIKASHILMENQEEAKKILERAKAGEDFNELAMEFSIDPSAKENSGELGYFSVGDMVPEFEKAAFALEPGQISDLVQSDFGFHIIKAEDKKTLGFDEAKSQIREELLPGKRNEFFVSYFEELKSKAEIIKYLENL
ncbi:MAG: peptidylprolyl isomerase, partial [Lutispora sp.]|nr:peptidylprolyl isomerase [Lutispora sp.]